MDEPGSIKDEPGSIKDEPGSIMDEPGSIMDEPGSIMDEPGSVKDESGCVMQAHDGRQDAVVTRHDGEPPLPQETDADISGPTPTAGMSGPVPVPESAAGGRESLPESAAGGRESLPESAAGGRESLPVGAPETGSGVPPHAISPRLPHASPGFRRFLLITLILDLPLTAYALWLLPTLDSLMPHPDVPGLIAVSIGIVGILVFFIFLYKYQTTSSYSFRGRMIALAIHGGLEIGMFVLIIWLGFGMEWSFRPLWGSYDCSTVARSWIIAVIVIGTISALGSLFDAMRTKGRGPFLPRDGWNG